MLDKLAIQNRLNEIQKRRSLLEDYALMDSDTFCLDFNNHELALRHLQVAIEAVIDVAKIIISANKLHKPLETKEYFDILVKEKIIDANLASKLKSATGFRNIVVHSYLDIDLDKVYEFIQNDLIDFDLYTEAVFRYLKRV